MNNSAGLHIALFSPHGLLRGRDMELGRDADTGGQILYVVELARALGRHPDVHHVDLFTRRVIDPKVSDTYAEPIEELGANARIVRVECGPRRYLRKEVLWPYLGSFVDNVLRYWRTRGGGPDLLHAHYADAGWLCARLAGLLGLPMAFTGHSLGRVKRARLLEQGQKPESIEKRYHITTRIEAEEVALDNAAFVIASTTQEVEEQYKVYDNYDPQSMNVIPPGVDLDRFTPPDRGALRNSPVYNQFDRFLQDMSKPMILALSRPDPRKNLIPLVRAYAENKALRERANLVLIAGTREDIREMEKGPRQQLMQILGLIDYYDLYGQIAYPKSHGAEEVPEFYRLAAKTGGVFVNPALTEPFGLTLIEAAASGLPMVATRDGGPQDIISYCKNGLLIDPLDQEGIGSALLEAISDKERWKQWSRNGIAGSKKHFSWEGHVQKYVRIVKKTIGKKYKQAVIHRQPAARSFLIADRIIICDVDDTLTGDREALAAFRQRLAECDKKVLFGIATGRSLELTLEALEEWDVPPPDLYITSVGTEIHYGAMKVRDNQWIECINYRWTPDAIREAMKDVPGVTLQGPRGQQSHKISYDVDVEKAPKIREIVRKLRRAGIHVNAIFSHNAYLDLLPVRTSKGNALRYVSIRWNIPPERILVAGDSGNDEEMLSGNTLGVVVGNHSSELEKLRGRPQIYFAQAHHAAGVLEGIDYYDFLGDIRIPDRETTAYEPSTDSAFAGSA